MSTGEIEPTAGELMEGVPVPELTNAVLDAWDVDWRGIKNRDTKVDPALHFTRALLDLRGRSELTDEEVLAEIVRSEQTVDGWSHSGRAILQQAAGAFQGDTGVRIDGLNLSPDIDLDFVAFAPKPYTSYYIAMLAEYGFTSHSASESLEILEGAVGEICLQFGVQGSGQLPMEVDEGEVEAYIDNLVENRLGLHDGYSDMLGTVALRYLNGQGDDYERLTENYPVLTNV